MRTTCQSALRHLAVAGMALASSAHAQTPAPGPWSAGVEGGTARMSVVCNAPALPCDRSASAFGLAAAYAVDRQWGARLSWTGTRGYSGSDSTDSGVDYGGDLRFNVVGAAATWRTPLGPVQLELRAGVAAVEGKYRPRVGGSSSARKTSAQPLVGVAVEYPLDGRLALRLDTQLTRGKVARHSGNLSTLGAGIVVRF